MLVRDPTRTPADEATVSPWRHLLHRLAHRLRLNRREAVAWKGDGYRIDGHRCLGCGAVSGVIRQCAP